MAVITAVNVETQEVQLLDVLNMQTSGQYKGLWNAATNEPFLVNGVGETGDYYEVSVAGTVDFGDGEIIFVVGDTVAYSAGKWNKGDKPLINDDDIALDTTWSSSKILQVIETASTADVYTYKGETAVLPDGTQETPNNKGDVWLLTTDGLPYWWDGNVWKRFGVDAYTKTETDTLLAGKVDKETGKGLSTEDFTTAEKTKLAGIEDGAEVNTIESVSVNNVALTPDANKNVNVTVPTKTSDITNDSNFVTTSDLATVAETGSYDDLTDKPTLGTASEKDSTTYVNPGNNNIPTSNAVYQAMTSMLEGAFHPAGNKTCAELTSDLLVQANVGHIYKITDNGVTDANWIGGAGQTITANQLAVVVYGNTVGTFLFNLENGINVDMSTYQTKAITPITVDGTVKSNVEDALDAINTLAGSNKTGLGNKADKVSGATNGNFAGLDANGNLTDSGINVDSLNDLQLTYNGSNYPTTSDLITQLTSDIVARKHSAGTVGGNIAITWTGKSCVTGTYSIHSSGAGFVMLDFENAQDGNKHCVYYISNGSATGITWSNLATKSNFYNLSSYGGYATGTKIWWKIPNLFVVGADFTYRTNVFLLSARESGCSALLTIGDNGSNTRTAKIIMLNGTLDGVTDFYFDSSTCSLYYSIQWSRLQIVQLSGQKIDIVDAIQSSSSEATQYTAITPTITATKSDIAPSDPGHGRIHITSVVGANATATTNYTKVKVGDLLNIVIDNGVSFTSNWWGTVSGLSALGITNIQSYEMIQGTREIFGRVCSSQGNMFLDLLGGFTDTQMSTTGVLDYTSISFPLQIYCAKRVTCQIYTSIAHMIYDLYVTGYNTTWCEVRRIGGSEGANATFSFAYGDGIMTITVTSVTAGTLSSAHWSS